jgi:poly-gamma-glutamate synthesis protein (capsule biosynthesis protein)
VTRIRLLSFGRFRADLRTCALSDGGQPTAQRPERAIPLKLEFAYTRLADGGDFAWVRRRFREAWAAFGTEVAEEGGRLVARWR